MGCTGEVHHYWSAATGEQLDAAPGIAALNELPPFLYEHFGLPEEDAHLFSNQLVSRDSQNGRPRDIYIQTLSVIVQNEDSVEDVPKNDANSQSVSRKA